MAKQVTDDIANNSSLSQREKNRQKRVAKQKAKESSVTVPHSDLSTGDIVTSQYVI